MAQITVNGTEDNAVAADGARVYLEFALVDGTAPVRWSFGATYSATNSQALYPGVPRVFTGSLAEEAVSFQVASGIGLVDVSFL